jgi:hypothetical protein
MEVEILNLMKHDYVPYFDNVSFISEEVSDILCLSNRVSLSNLIYNKILPYGIHFSTMELALLETIGSTSGYCICLYA